MNVTRICFFVVRKCDLNLCGFCLKGVYLPNDVGANMFTIGGFPNAFFFDMVSGVRGSYHEILLDIDSRMGYMIFFAIGAVGPEEQIAGFGLRAWGSVCLSWSDTAGVPWWGYQFSCALLCRWRIQ